MNQHEAIFILGGIVGYIILMCFIVLVDLFRLELRKSFMIKMGMEQKYSEWIKAHWFRNFFN